VHYCPREALLAERRKKSRFDRNGIPEDPAQARLRLLRRTVRDDPTRLGKMVRFLKIPYMLRESCHVELAQTIAVLPNLHYVDLPEGMFSDEPNLATLRLEVQARCPNIRKMTYLGGSEGSFANLSTGRVWPRLEVLELTGINIDPVTMRNVLVSLQNLRALKVSETQSFSDEVLICEDGLPSLPPLAELVLTDTPRLTAAGLADYLAWQETQQALKVLTLKDTGVKPASLQDILTVTPALKTLAIQCKVIEPFPLGANIRPLASRSLETLRFEISGGAGRYSGVESSFYGYLANSVLSGGFPNLRTLYVLDDSMPEQLQGLPPPNASFAGGRQRSSSFTAAGSRPGVPALRLSPDDGGGLAAPLSPLLPQPRRPLSNLPPATSRLSSNNPFASTTAARTHTLEVFTKSDEFGKWNFARVNSYQPSRGGGGRGGDRPISSYGLGSDITGHGWSGGEARRSVMVGDGTGAYLALPGQQENNPLASGYGDVPFEDPMRPRSSGGDSIRSKDLWR
jgi:hypothetical protein